jgi:hypothetical protein
MAIWAETCSKDNTCLNKGHADIVAYKGVFIYFLRSSETGCTNQELIIFVVCVYVCLCLCDAISLLGTTSVKTFRWEERVVKGFIFFAVRVVSKESRRFVLKTFLVHYFQYILKQAYMPSTNTSLSFCSAHCYVCQH